MIWAGLGSRIRESGVGGFLGVRSRESVKNDRLLTPKFIFWFPRFFRVRGRESRVFGFFRESESRVGYSTDSQALRLLMQHNYITNYYKLIHAQLTLANHSIIEVEVCCYRIYKLKVVPCVRKKIESNVRCLQ